MSFLQSNRLILRKMDFDDFEEISKMLKNPNVMYAWEYEFTNNDVESWINRNLELYKECNLGFFIAVEKSSGKVVGQFALMPDTIDGKNHHEISYILNPHHQKKGYALEGAKLLVDYAFDVLKLQSVIFEIRPTNLPSLKIAQNLKAIVDGSFIKNVRGKKMEHLIYRLNATSHS